MANTEESSLAEGIGYQPGEEIGRYEVIARIAIGGQSIIYKCHDPALDRLVAIKQISTHLAEDKMFLDRFRTEAQILARLGAEQPEVVTIHDLLENRQGLFIVMEFIEGISLEKTLSGNPGPVELKATLQILWRLCSALHTVHIAGVIHRDIKPSNIIIADGLRPMITDFGVAATSSGEASMVMGTTKYMAPELFTGGYVDGRADMYSLGFIAYEMLVGREKFNEIFTDIVRDRTAEKVRWMKWHSNPKVSAPPPHEVNEAVPITLSNIVLRMIAKDSEQRFAGMEDLGRAIKQTFRPGAKAAGASVPVAPVEEEIVSTSAGRTVDAMAFDLEEDVTAPIPKRKLSLGVKISLAVAAMLLIVGVLVVRGIMQSGEEVDRNKIAKKAYQSAREVYKNADYSKAEENFLAVRKNFPETTFADPSQVYIHMCRAYLAVASRDWSRAQTEQDLASDLTLKIQTANPSEIVYEWTRTMKDSIKGFDLWRINQKAFDETMAKAENLFNAGKYDDAVTLLNEEYDEPKRLDADQQVELRNFKNKVTRRQSLDECESLMVAARKANSSDTGTALAAWDKASAGLQRLKPHIDAAKWLRMQTEVDKARASLTKNKRLRDIMSVVDSARQSGDKDRLLRALRNAMPKAGVPPKLVESWAAEIKSIKETVDFAKVTKLLVSGDTKGAIDALNAFIEQYPNNRKAKVIKEGLLKKEADILAEKEAFRLFDLGRWGPALEKLQVLRVKKRGRRDIKEKMLHCQYKLEMVVFEAAVKAYDLDKAIASGERARVFNPDAWDTVIDPKLSALRARAKVAATLAKGAAALKNTQYPDVRKILDHLKDSYPEAATMIRQSRYRENLAKGNAAKQEDDIKTALGLYKIARNYAKDPAEHTEINALISAATQALGGS
ncbi:MAG: protein kinase [Phycisphaerae bacterium]|jgi:tRNA A-37 threonylcarbamoyl transferase component Bud32/TolA-binding protein|nr:protein kinase [Phycisphaerae bacterium]